ncbi:hypothetical protein DL546_006275, partial [Coniochaeta pulveracea]
MGRIDIPGRTGICRPLRTLLMREVPRRASPQRLIRLTYVNLGFRGSGATAPDVSRAPAARPRGTSWGGLQQHIACSIGPKLQMSMTTPSLPDDSFQSFGLCSLVDLESFA